MFSNNRNIREMLPDDGLCDAILHDFHYASYDMRYSISMSFCSDNEENRPSFGNMPELYDSGMSSIMEMYTISYNVREVPDAFEKVYSFRETAIRDVCGIFEHTYVFGIGKHNAAYKISGIFNGKIVPCSIIKDPGNHLKHAIQIRTENI